MLDLVRAFDEARLAALHIDMQNGYFNIAGEAFSNTASTFPIVGQFAQDLRDVEVPNFWAVYTFWSRIIPHAKFRAKHFDEDFHESVTPSPYEIILEKARRSVFHSSYPPHEDYLKEKGFDSLIIDGVIDEQCVKETLIGAVKANFRVYLAIDATNTLPEDREKYEANLRQKLSEEENKLLTITTTQEIKSALSDKKLINKPKPPMAVASFA